MNDYVPRAQYQLDDDLYPGMNCSLNAAGVMVDKDTLGLIVPDPDTLRAALLPDRDGLTMSQVLWALDRVYDWQPELHGDYTPAMLLASLERQRGAFVSIVRAPLGNRCGQSFNGTHGVYVQQPSGVNIRLYDPLCRTSDWVPWADFVVAGVALGAMVGHPGKIRAALTRAERVNPFVTIRPKKGQARVAYHQYIVQGSTITGTKRATTAGFQASCTRPRVFRWPGRQNQQLVQITYGGYSGKWVNPAGASVRYAGE